MLFISLNRLIIPLIHPKFNKIFLILTVFLATNTAFILAQCPSRIWDASNFGSGFVNERENKAIFGDFTNTRRGQYVNDGNLYFFGDINNFGFIGDGNGQEFIYTCDSTTTHIEGNGLTEFNNLEVDNPGGIILKKDIRIMNNMLMINGIIHTDRSVFRERVFFLEGATYDGANDLRHINGSVARQGTGQFDYPTGDGFHMAPIRAEGENTFDIFVATYHSLQLDSLQYASKGIFPREERDFDVAAVQPREFWTLSGGQSTKVTLFWDTFSEINNLTDNINNLVVVGWDGEKWVNLGNTDLVQVFGSGSVTSTTVMPDRYDAFTFGILDSDGDFFVDSDDPAPFDPCIPDDTSPACQSGSTCIDLNLGVYLEGALLSNRIGEYNEEMRTILNRFGYLPGQRPATLLGTRTPPGQPYTIEPWDYRGDEGFEFDVFAQGGSELYPADVVDWVLVSVRISTDRLSRVCEKAAILLADGTVRLTEPLDCCQMTEDEYFVVIEHRNHLPVMSPTALPIVDGVITFDFRANQSFRALLGNGQKLIEEGKYAMFAGNGDQVTSSSSVKDINANDLNLWTIENGEHSGYYLQDYDLNGDVNVHDKAIWLTNNGTFTDVDR